MTKKGKYPEAGSNAKPAAGINIVRKDYLLDTRVIIATARAKRPEQFSAPKETPMPKAKCPFCPQNQDKVIVADEEPDPKSAAGWKFRSVVNLFGIVSQAGKPPAVRDWGDRLFEEHHAYGHAEVVIESPDHDAQLEEMPVETIAEYLAFLGRRVKALQNSKGVRYVCVFKNRGKVAGASISHTHTQIVTTPSVPTQVVGLMEASYSYLVKRGKNPFTDILKRELAGPRAVADDPHVACFTPFASEFPFELWFVPKRDVPALSRLNAEERLSLASMIKKAIGRLDTMGKPPYNMLFIGDNEYGELQFHIRLTPRLSTPPAGFEFITDMTVNPVPPEAAAEFYRPAFKR